MIHLTILTNHKASRISERAVSRSGLACINGFEFYDPSYGHGCFRSFAGFLPLCSTTISAGGHTS